MATNPARRQVSTSRSSVMRWLLDSDPLIRWQVMRDLTDAPADEVGVERARVATEVGRAAARAPAARRTVGGAAWNRGGLHDARPGLLREIGLDPASISQARGRPRPRPRDLARMRPAGSRRRSLLRRRGRAVHRRPGRGARRRLGQASAASSTGCSPSSCPTAARTAAANGSSGRLQHHDLRVEALLEPQRAAGPARR